MSLMWKKYEHPKQEAHRTPSRQAWLGKICTTHASQTSKSETHRGYSVEQKCKKLCRLGENGEIKVIKEKYNCQGRILYPAKL